MQVIVGKIIGEKEKDLHQRILSYVDVAKKISDSFKTEGRVSYLMLYLERNGMLINEYLGGKSLDEIEKMLESAKAYGIDESIPNNFLINKKIWRIEDEAPVRSFRGKVCLKSEDLATKELEVLRNYIKSLGSAYFIEVEGKRP